MTTICAQCGGDDFHYGHCPVVEQLHEENARQARAIRIMNWLYDQEQNLLVASFWDGGWHVALGDDTNGFSDQRGVGRQDLVEGIEWLLGAYLREHPESRASARTAGLLEGEADG